MTARVRAWFGRSTNRQILGASATIAVLTLVARAASLARDVAVAYGFGRGDELDAFLIALLLPTFAINVVANSLNAAFVPVFIEVRERDGAARADLLFQSVLAVSVPSSSPSRCWSGSRSRRRFLISPGTSMPPSSCSRPGSSGACCRSSC